MKVPCYPKITIATWFSPITCFYTLNIALVPSQNCPLVPIVADQKYTGVYTNVFFICFLYYFSLFCFVFFCFIMCVRVHTPIHIHFISLYMCKHYCPHWLEWKTTIFQRLSHNWVNDLLFQLGGPLSI